MKKRVWILAFCLAGLIMASCGKWKEGEALLTGQWLLVSVKSGPDLFPMGSRWVTYRFQSGGTYLITESGSTVEKGTWTLTPETLDLARENGTLEKGILKKLSTEELEVYFPQSTTSFVLKTLKSSGE